VILAALIFLPRAGARAADAGGGSLTVAWSSDANGLNAWSDIGVDEDTLILADYDSEGGRVVVRILDALTGKEILSTSAPALGESSGGPTERSVPLADANAIYVTGPGGDLLVFDRPSGQLRWKRNVRNDFEAADWFQAASSKSRGIIGKNQSSRVLSPLLHGDTVIVSPQGKKAALVAFDKTNGEIVWQSPPIGSGGLAAPILTTLSGTPQVVVAFHRRAAGFDPESGAQLWEAPLYSPSQIEAAPLPLSGDRLVFFYNTAVPEVFTIRQAKSVWEADLTSVWMVAAGSLRTPILDSRRLILISPGGYHTIQGIACFDSDNYEPLWAAPLKEKNKADGAADEKSANAGRKINPRSIHAVHQGLLYVIEPEGGLVVFAPPPSEYKAPDMWITSGYIKGDSFPDGWAPLSETSTELKGAHDVRIVGDRLILRGKRGTLAIRVEQAKLDTPSGK
jgi:outer membrane protein assembly factor BamB